MNCSLALALANTYIRQTTNKAYTLIEITKLLATCETPLWPSRFHCIHIDDLKLYIDRAHNELGIVHAVD
jgi:folylpolyglutamate synthase/dihydropteroate synthase